MPISEARKWARAADAEGKDAGYHEAVKVLKRSVSELVKLGIVASRG